VKSENRIHKLPPAIAERIAAGEVIERPSSVVKELIENSLDAGATEISVRLEDGGKNLIEVIDNGCGMSPSDLALSIERHATSKLSSLEDLDRIATLGFRGEALPSVSAVAEVSIISRTLDGDSAYELIAGDVADRGLNPPAAKRVTFGHFNNASHGTRIQARGLFSQVPARLKFLKSPAAEVSAVREWVERLALAYPQVGFQVSSGDRKLLKLRPQTELERVQEILGEGEEYPIVFAENDRDAFRDRGLEIRLYWLQGLSSPQNRRLVQVVNRRPLRDRFLQQALMAPFRQSLLPGQFPAIALLIEINPAALDVNVHPTKSEVRFLDKNKIFSTLDHLVRGMIAKNGAPGRVPLQFSNSFSKSNDDYALSAPPSWTAETKHPSVREEVEAFSSGSSRSNSWSASSSDSPPSFGHASAHAFGHSFEPSFGPSWSTQFSLAQTSSHLDREVPSNSSQAQLAIPVHSPQFSGPPVAILFHTYLVYEQGEELVLIDQHAAHERIRYEKVKTRLKKPENNSSSRSSQALLIPETVKFKEAELASVQTRLPLLERLGFEVEIFGEDTLLFRSTPTEWGHRNLKIRLKNLIEKLLEYQVQEENLWIDETLFESLASEACHSAVRAGDSLSLLEAQQLTHDLFLCEHPWNCPHGRPTIVRVPMRKLEEWFQRKL
jgi:DNA mismatch repair protein MutL